MQERTGTTNAERVRTAFAGWEQGDSRPFFALVSPSVTWRVIGSTALSGTYHDKATFLTTAGRLFGRLAGPIMAEVVAVHDVGDTVVLQWHGRSRGVNGRPYEQDYCWVLRFGESDGGRGDAEIVDVVAYLDTALIDDMFAD
ncbi:MAG: nuclear transport factor 2 family protein [Acidimicrobiales bacterium]